MADNSQETPKTNQRVVLNVGGTRFETYVSTLTKYPESLLGAMFHERNMHMRKPDERGEYFFDRSPLTFEIILNFYRTGKLIRNQVPKALLEEEIEFWQIPTEISQPDEHKLGIQLAFTAVDVLRSSVSTKLEKIKAYIIDAIQSAANKGVQSFSIEFKESQDQEFYAFLSNFSHRELLLHDLIQENFDVSFNDITSGQGHSYVLFVTLWNRYTKHRPKDTVSAMAKILDELRAGIEVKTTKDDHILTVKNTYI